MRSIMMMVIGDEIERMESQVELKHVSCYSEPLLPAPSTNSEVTAGRGEADGAGYAFNILAKVGGTGGGEVFVVALARYGEF